MTREEAIRIIESNCSCTDSKLREACAMFIPELRESEDERIRKELIGMINECTNWAHKKEYITYLEKQKEQPTNEEMLRTLRAEYEKGVADTIAKYEQNPAEWSEEDTKFLRWLRDRLIYVYKEDPNTDFVHKFERLIETIPYLSETTPLTWEDMRRVDMVLEKMMDDDILGNLPEDMDDKEYYTEVLRRYEGVYDLSEVRKGVHPGGQENIL
jgi:hypothetical protein